METIVFIAKGPQHIELVDSSNQIAEQEIVKSNTYNGYVAVPKDNLFFDCDDHPYGVDFFKDIYIHGGITYSKVFNLAKESIVKVVKGNLEDLLNNIPEYWVIGFDTLHCGDTPQEWTIDKVAEEALKLEKQLTEKEPYIPKFVYDLVLKIEQKRSDKSRN